MVLSLGLEHSRQAMEAQRAVTNMTNELLRKNADTLKMGSIETAKEAERGIVDIEDAQIYQPVADKHAGRGAAHSAGRRAKAQNAERELRLDRGRTQAEDARDARLSTDERAGGRQ